MIEIIAYLTAGAFFFLGLGFFTGWRVGTKATEGWKDFTIDELKIKIKEIENK